MRAEAIVRALGGKSRGPQGIAPCPVPTHGRGRGDRHPSLSIKEGDQGRVLVHCHAGCEPSDVIDALKEKGLWPDAPRGRGVRRARSRPRPMATRPPTDDSVWRRAWEQAVELHDTPGEQYLIHARRVGLPVSDVLRFHASAPFSLDGARRTPGLIAIVQSTDGSVIGAQVTALRPDGSGKAGGRRSRFNFGAIAGGAVRLAPLQDGDRASALAIAEGVETALGFTALCGYPCWAALGANLKSFTCPRNADELVIAADNDAAGIDCAMALAKRECAERFVEIRAPLVAGQDWADVAARRLRHV